MRWREQMIELTHPDRISEMADDELGRKISSLKRQIISTRNSGDDDTYSLEVELCYLQSESFHRRNRRDALEQMEKERRGRDNQEEFGQD